MNSSEPEHPWLFAMRRQRRWIYFSIALSIALHLGAATVIVFLLATNPGLKHVLVILGCALAVIVIPIALMGIQARKQRRLTQQMLESDGLSCPKCLLPLSIEGEPTVQCSKCSRVYKPAELRQYWEWLVTDPVRAGAWWVQNYGTAWRSTYSKWMLRDGRPQTLPILLGTVLVFVMTGVLLSFFTGESLLIGAFKYVQLILIMNGFMLFGIGRRRRVGSAKYCARCHYEQGPQANPPPKCPECGSAWNAVGGTVTGQRSPNRKMMFAGALLVVVGFAFMFTPFLGGWQFKLLPTGPLITQAINKPGFTFDEWSELRTRLLTPEQIRRLATGLLDKRLGYPWLSSDEGNWLVAQIVNGRMPDDLTLRYYREMMDVELLAPSKAKVGEQVTLRLAFTNRGSSTSHPAAHALIGGYLIGDDPQPIGRQSNAIAGVSLDATMRGGSNVANESSFVPQHAGEMKVRARVWVAILPITSGGHMINWQPDGSPVIPSQAVWHEMRELERTIVVE